MTRGVVVVLLLCGCGPVTADCGPDSCSGCCSDGVCETGDSTSACGSGGNACDVCVGAQVCSGRCENSSGAGGGGGTGGGTATGGGNTGGGSGGGGGAMPCTTDTWSSFGASFFSAWCSSCHGTFTHATVQADASLYSSVISGGAMPRGGGLSSTLRSEAVKYLNCGAP